MRKHSHLSTRRSVIAGACCSCALALPLSSACAQASEELSPESFGAAGDGRTDDWEAFRRLTEAINRRGGGVVRLGRGKTYYFGRYNRAGRPSYNLAFANCSGLTIEGSGAKIDLKGDFDRDVAGTHALTGLFFSKCRNLVVRDLEIDGNVEQMTNSAKAGEPPSYGLCLASCTDVSLSNLDLHHHSSDGLMIRDAGATPSRQVCRRVRGDSIRCRHNARQGMSIVALRGGMFTDCDFSWTGRDQGRYSGHSPQAGVDVEPGRDTASPGQGRMDEDTGDIGFLRCTFRENRGAQFVCGGSRRYDTIRVSGCTITVGGGSEGGADAVIFGAPSSVMENCGIDIGDASKRLYLWPNKANRTGNFQLIGNRVSGNGELLRIHGSPSGAITIDGNEFVHRGNSGSGRRVWLLAGAPKVRLRRNRLFVPGAIHQGGRSAQVVLATHVELAEANVYRTDLSPAGGAHFSNQYGPSTVVIGDVYAGTAPGPADSFRPFPNASHDTRQPFSKP